MEADREASMGSEDESSLAKFSSNFDQVILPLGQIINICSYFYRFNILLPFLGDTKQTEAIL